MSDALLPAPAVGPLRRGRVRTSVVRGAKQRRSSDAAPVDDPLRRLARWIRRSFAGTDDASASVIASWTTAVFLTSACQRLADDLARLGHTTDGTAEAILRTGHRASELTTSLRSSPMAAERRHVTASQLDEIRRQLRLEVATVARRLAAVEADDAHARRALAAVIEAAVWLGVQDLRGALEELCATSDGSVATWEAVEAFHDIVGTAVRPRRVDAGRVVRPQRVTLTMPDEPEPPVPGPHALA